MQSGNNANINPARSVPTATQMHIRGGSNEYNTSGSNYIAYIFAHDDATFGMDGDKAALKCGTYTGNGSSQEISLGFEPQWMLVKNTTDDNTDWRLWTIMDGCMVELHLVKTLRVLRFMVASTSKFSQMSPNS